MNSDVSAPSYGMSAIGGLFLGILAVAIVLFVPGVKWIYAIIPLMSLLAGLLGTYVSAEPYEALRENYDKLLTDAAAMQSGGITESQREEIRRDLIDEIERLKAAATERNAESGGAGEKVREESLASIREAVERLETESLKLVRRAAELGEDGLSTAEAAEVLRELAGSLGNRNGLK